MIKKREYDKALKVVIAYEKQLLNRSIAKSSFGFLWFNEKDEAHNRYVKAKNIEGACKGFMSNKPKTMVRIDYEVQHGSEYIDISTRKEFENFL